MVTTGSPCSGPGDITETSRDAGRRDARGSPGAWSRWSRGRRLSLPPEIFFRPVVRGLNRAVSRYSPKKEAFRNSLSQKALQVGAAGFEPATLWSQTGF